MYVCAHRIAECAVHINTYLHTYRSRLISYIHSLAITYTLKCTRTSALNVHWDWSIALTLYVFARLYMCARMCVCGICNTQRVRMLNARSAFSARCIQFNSNFIISYFEAKNNNSLFFAQWVRHLFNATEMCISPVIKRQNDACRRRNAKRLWTNVYWVLLLTHVYLKWLPLTFELVLSAIAIYRFCCWF